MKKAKITIEYYFDSSLSDKDITERMMNVMDHVEQVYMETTVKDGFNGSVKESIEDVQIKAVNRREI